MRRLWWLLLVPVVLVAGGVALAAIDVDGDNRLNPVSADVMPPVAGAEVLSSTGYKGVGCCENPPARREVRLQVAASTSAEAVGRVTQAFTSASWTNTGCSRWAGGMACLTTSGYTAGISPRKARSTPGHFIVDVEIRRFNPE